MRTIDLSCDLGEAENPAALAQEEELWRLVTSANVACGGHTGDETTMRRAARAARSNGVRFGAHPSYPDRESFGRRPMAIGHDALSESLAGQLRTIARAAAAEGVEVRHVKPHGALYNDAHHSRDRALSITEAVREISSRLTLVCSDNSVLAEVAREAGLVVEPEAFADRRYRCDRSLVPRTEEGSLLLDAGEAARQALALAERREVVTRCGRRTPIHFSTICAHGDMENTVERVRAVREALLGGGFDVSSGGRA